MTPEDAELIERLREAHWHCTCHEEAADRLDALAAEVAALRELLYELRADGWIREDHSDAMTGRIDAALAAKGTK